MKKFLVICLIGMVNVAFGQSPANNTCAGAITLNCGSSVTGNNSMATDDVLPGISCGTGVRGYFKGVWYKINPAVSGLLAIRTCGTAWDSYLRVYTGTCASLTQCISYDDSGPCGQAAGTIFNAQAGTTYYVLMAGYNSVDYGPFSLSVECVNTCIPPAINYLNSTYNTAYLVFEAVGNYIIEYGLSGFTPGAAGSAGAGTIINSSTGNVDITGLQPATGYDVYIRKICTTAPLTYSSNSSVYHFTALPPPPVNDECINALSIGDIPVFSSIVSASESLTAAYCEGNSTVYAQDVWFKYRADAAGYRTIKLNNVIGFNPVVEVFTGSCSTLSSVGCADINGLNEPESFGFTASAGQDYYVRVYGHQEAGNFGIVVCKGQATLSSSATTFCSGSTITLTAGGVSGQYLWYRDNILIDDENASTLVASLPGTYIVKVLSGVCDFISNPIELLPAMISPGLSGTGVYNDNDYVNIGIPLTQQTQTYAWKKAGLTVYGPLNGNGGNQSFQFYMSDPSKAGTYQVESTRYGCQPVYSGQVNVYYGGITNLKLDNCPYNTVQFSWHNYHNPVALFQYSVGTEDYPSGTIQTTTGTSISVQGLQPSTLYYIHVRGATFYILEPWAASFSNSEWVTLSFVTEAGPIAAGTEWTGAFDTDWFNQANWRCGVVPTENSTVIIPSAKPRYPVIGADTKVKSITISTGATINLLAGKKLEVANP
ncbi:MAG: hypothetical protein EOO06_11340 [Chitinophagaceae bacterium]|nr:MAG: hypothetical protein EOO06_11340 [Chitinophagaceae bacterium]